MCTLALTLSAHAADSTEPPVANTTADPMAAPTVNPTPTHENDYTYKGAVGYKGEVMAEPEMKRNHFEGIGALGIGKLNAANSYLGVTQSETDSLVQTNSSSWDTFGAQLGAGYIFNRCGTLQCSDHVQWFTAIEPQVNLYYLASNSIKGNVVRFNNANFNQMTYDMPVHSTRLMLDAAVTVAAWRQVSIYAKGGIGSAWTSISYHDSDNGGNTCANQAVSLSSRTSGNFAWEAGPGLLVDLNKRFGLSFEYLFANLGTVKTSAHGSTGTITTPIVTPASFKLKTQTALLGLHIAL